MKKIIAMVIILALSLSMAGCGKDTFRIGIQIPAEDIADFMWADEEISPKGRRIKITSSDEFGDVELCLMPIEAKEENAYEPIVFVPGESVTMEVERGAWYKVGMRMPGNAVSEKVKYFEIKGVTVRVSAGVAATESECK